MAKKKEVEEKVVVADVVEEPVIQAPDTSFLADLYELRAKLDSLKITRMSDLDGLISREIQKQL
jgi:hypothetical protein